MMNANDEGQGFLTKEELQFVEQKVVRPADVDLTYAQVFPIRRIANPNAKSDEYFIAEDDEGAAELVNALESAPSLAVSNSRVVYPVNKIKLQSGLAVEDIETSRAHNTPLNVAVLNRIKRAVDVKVNALAYVGDQKFGIPGLYSGSGFTAISGTSWGTAGLDLANEVIKYMNTLPVQYRQMMYSLVLPDASYQKLMLYFNSASAVGDRSHMERIKAAYPNLQIVSESTLAAGTTIYDGSTVAAGIAFLVPKVEEYCCFSVAKAPYVMQENKIVDEKVNMAIATRVGTVETPFPTAIGKITGIN